KSGNLLKRENGPGKSGDLLKRVNGKGSGCGGGDCCDCDVSETS
ncbi:21363_t:CDS:1, partial [Cetraspora pellucida]